MTNEIRASALNVISTSFPPWQSQGGFLDCSRMICTQQNSFAKIRQSDKATSYKSKLHKLQRDGIYKVTVQTCIKESSPSKYMC